MALILADRVQETSATTGTGTLTLDGASSGYQTFSVGIGNGNTCYYTIQSDTGAWEVGVGTVGAGTLARTTLISSSTGSAISFSGTLTVFVTYPAEKAIYQDAAGNTSVPSLGATTPSTGAFTTASASTSVTTPIVQATNSGGLALKNSAGTTQISMGAGGGDNCSVNVSTNLNGANAQIDISPTGTGHVHIKPSGSGAVEINPTSVGTIDNMTIGATTPKAITGTTITGTSFVGSGSSLTGVVTSVTGTAPVVSSGGTTPAISMAAATASINGYLTSTDWSTFNAKLTSGGALGTPSSGTVTNLTGTASININGTVGATTPNSGAFTTLTSSTSFVPTAYTETIVASGTVGASATLAITAGTVLTATLTSATACTFTMPTATAGKSFTLLLKQPASGSATTATFTGVKWNSGGAPVITATLGRLDILAFVADGTNWYGTASQGYTY
jgi:hypothetical protein